MIDIIHPLAWAFAGAATTFCLIKFKQTKVEIARLQAKRIQERTISNLHLNKRGKISDKWASYLTYYDTLFEPLKDEPVSLFEIGTQNGGSLEVWLAYFRNAQKIIGCDINERCRNLRYDDPRVSVVVGDANSADIVHQVQPQAPFDIIIDDGSHRSEDIRDSFLIYFPMLKPGGLFVIEDTHCLFFAPSPNMDSNDNVLALFRELSNTINYEFWADTDKVETRIPPLLNGNAVPAFIMEGWVDSIEFRNSIITIRKALTPSFNKLGPRKICGDDAIADAAVVTERARLAALEQQ